MPLTLESVLKNFEEFAQHQWPTWAKRRGWIAEFPDASQPQEADDSGRVVQLDKDKWVFQRRRKKTELPPIDLVRFNFVTFPLVQLIVYIVYARSFSTLSVFIDLAIQMLQIASDQVKA
jgi:hypothetical protein